MLSSALSKSQVVSTIKYTFCSQVTSCIILDINQCKCFRLIILNFCKPLKKKNSEGCPSNQVSAASMTFVSDEKWQTFNCFFSQVGIRTYQHSCMMRKFKTKPNLKNIRPQFRYNVIMWHAQANIIPVEKQYYIKCVCLYP